jgi:hypothetical protein
VSSRTARAKQRNPISKNQKKKKKKKRWGSIYYILHNAWKALYGFKEVLGTTYHDRDCQQQTQMETSQKPQLLVKTDGIWDPENQ